MEVFLFDNHVSEQQEALRISGAFWGASNSHGDRNHALTSFLTLNPCSFSTL